MYYLTATIETEKYKLLDTQVTITIQRNSIVSCWAWSIGVRCYAYIFISSIIWHSAVNPDHILTGLIDWLWCKNQSAPFFRISKTVVLSRTTKKDSAISKSDSCFFYPKTATFVILKSHTHRCSKYFYQHLVAIWTWTHSVYTLYYFYVGHFERKAILPERTEAKSEDLTQTKKN